MLLGTSNQSLNVKFIFQKKTNAKFQWPGIQAPQVEIIILLFNAPLRDCEKGVVHFPVTTQPFYL